jgi:hypothetical protein
MGCVSLGDSILFKHEHPMLKGLILVKLISNRFAILALETYSRFR